MVEAVALCAPLKEAFFIPACMLGCALLHRSWMRSPRSLLRFESFSQILVQVRSSIALKEAFFFLYLHAVPPSSSVVVLESFSEIFVPPSSTVVELLLDFWACEGHHPLNVARRIGESTREPMKGTCMGHCHKCGPQFEASAARGRSNRTREERENELYSLRPYNLRRKVQSVM